VTSDHMRTEVIDHASRSRRSPPSMTLNSMTLKNIMSRDVTNDVIINDLELDDLEKASLTAAAGFQIFDSDFDSPPSFVS
jgi:hypothetical protein